MRIDPQDHRGLLAALRRSGPLPPPSTWLPLVALAGGREPDAVLAEREDAGGTVTIALHAVVGGRLLRVVGTGTGHWDDPLAGDAPASVVAESWTVSGVKAGVLDAVAERDADSARWAYRPRLVVDCGGEQVTVPYLDDLDPAAEEAADRFTAALLAALG